MNDEVKSTQKAIVVMGAFLNSGFAYLSMIRITAI